jgi:hypothetical protein
MSKIQYYFAGLNDDILTHTFDNTAEQNTLRGTCSGIPECCVAFFVNDWKFGNHPNRGKHMKAGYGYIPCPACLESGNRVEIRHCLDGGCICGQVK